MCISLTARARARETGQRFALFRAMILADFYRNALSKRPRAETEERYLELDDPTALGGIDGIPHAEWKQRHLHEVGRQRQAPFIPANLHAETFSQ